MVRLTVYDEVNKYYKLENSKIMLKVFNDQIIKIKGT